MMPRPITLGFIIALLGLVGNFLYDRLTTVGAFRKPDSLRAGGVHDLVRIADTANCEDLHLDTASGLIFTACQEEDGSRAQWFPPLHRFADPKAGARGVLRVIDPKTFTASPIKIEGFTDSFSTHGIDIIRDPSDPNALYIHAVNHAPSAAYAASLDAGIENKAASRVEIFHHVLGSGVARHVRTVSHPLITTPNDIYSTGPLSFYVTNDHHYREGVLRFIEDLGGRRTAGWSTTLHVAAEQGKDGADGVAAKVALKGLHNNNGLGHSSNPDEVIICDAAGGMSYFANIGADDALTVKDEVKFQSTIDNPFWFTDPYPTTDHDASGLVNAGLSQGIKLADEIVDGPIATAVWIAHGKPGQGNWNTSLLYADDGSNIRSASASVLIAIDPKENGGKKQGWLFVSGFASKEAIAVKVDL